MPKKIPWKEFKEEAVISASLDSDSFKPFSYGHRHIGYTYCSRVHKQLRFVNPKQESEHHHTATICSAEDLVRTLREFYHLKLIIVEGESGNYICERCANKPRKDSTLKEASILAPPLGVRKSKTKNDIFRTIRRIFVRASR